MKVNVSGVGEFVLHATANSTGVNTLRTMRQSLEILNAVRFNFLEENFCLAWEHPTQETAVTP